MYWGLEHGPINNQREFEKKNQLKTKGSRAHTRKKTYPPHGQTWNCRVLKINWHLGLGIRNVWCEYEKDQLKTLGLQCTQENK